MLGNRHLSSSVFRNAQHVALQMPDDPFMILKVLTPSLVNHLSLALAALESKCRQGKLETWLGLTALNAGRIAAFNEPTFPAEHRGALGIFAFALVLARHDMILAKSTFPIITQQGPQAKIRLAHLAAIA
jgi:hypothetical protein